MTGLTAAQETLTQLLDTLAEANGALLLLLCCCTITPPPPLRAAATGLLVRSRIRPARCCTCAALAHVMTLPKLPDGFQEAVPPPGAQHAAGIRAVDD